MINANLHSIFDQANLVKPILRAAIAITKLNAVYDEDFTWFILTVALKCVKISDDAFGDYTLRIAHGRLETQII